MGLLNFKIAPFDGMLEATTDGGYYNISDYGNTLHVSGWVNGEGFDIGDFPDIYQALRAANAHYNKEEFLITCGMECTPGKMSKVASETLEQLIDMYEAGHITKSTLIVDINRFYESRC